MRVISIVSSKGGVGKTTLASALAVRATQESERVAMVDLDPQGSLAGWWHRRGGSQNPCIFSNADTASEAVEALALDGWDWVFIDTPPAFINIIDDAIEAAHLALIPLKAGAFDLLASEAVIMKARQADVRHLCVLNGVNPRWGITDRALVYLRSNKVPVAETQITLRQSYAAAVTKGLSGPEIERPLTGEVKSRSEAEIDALFVEVRDAARKAKRGRA